MNWIGQALVTFFALFALSSAFIAGAGFVAAATAENASERRSIRIGATIKVLTALAFMSLSLWLAGK